MCRILFNMAAEPSARANSANAANRVTDGNSADRANKCLLEEELNGGRYTSARPPRGSGGYYERAAVTARRTKLRRTGITAETKGNGTLFPAQGAITPKYLYLKNSLMQYIALNFDFSYFKELRGVGTVALAILF